MPDHTEKQIQQIVRKIADGKDCIQYSTLEIEVYLTLQKIIDQTREIKDALRSTKIHMNIGKMLLLCTQLEKIYSEFQDIKREYNL